MNFRSFFPIIAVVIAFAIGSIPILIFGVNPIHAYYTMFSGSLLDYHGLEYTINLAGVLILTALSALVAFKSRIWNIGGEGQLYMGAIAAVAVAQNLASLGTVALFLALISSSLAGALYASIGGFLKAKLQMDEIVTTILLNYIAILFLDFLVAPTGPLRDTSQSNNQTLPIPVSARLPTIFSLGVNVSIIFSVSLAIIVYLVMNRTKLGFEMRMMGGKLEAARYAGVNVPRMILTVMLISGALAGLAGGFLVTGIRYVLFDGVSKIYGYVGIGVAMLGQLNSVAVIFSSLLFSILDIGGVAMHVETNVSYEIAQTIEAIIVIAVLIRPLLERARSKG